MAVERAFGSGGDFFVHGQQVALAGRFAVQKDMRQGAGAAFGGFGGQPPPDFFGREALRRHAFFGAPEVAAVFGLAADEAGVGVHFFRRHFLYAAD